MSYGVRDKTILVTGTPASEGNHSVIVASEPLSDDPGWQRVAPNHLAIVHEDLHVEQRPIEH